MPQFTDSQCYVLYDNNGTFVDYTQEAFDPAKTFTFDLSTTKKLYIGKANTFNHRYFYLKTPKTGASLLIEYFEGTTWHTATKTYDTTYNMSQSGFLDWALPEEETQTTINGQEAYWIRISSTVATTGIEAYSIKNIYSDDTMVREYLPELSRYLPAGKTDFVYLHELAKNELMADLKEAGRIEYEDQVKDSLIPLQELSCYKFIELLLLPLIEDESIKFMYSQFSALYKKRLAATALTVDTNKDNIIQPGEINRITSTQISRV